MFLRIHIFVLSLILVGRVEVIELKGGLSLGLRQNAFSMVPEIRVAKWVSDADRDYLDWDDDTSVMNLEWNNKIDTDAIQISGFGSHEYVISQHVAAISIECKAQYPVEWVFHNSKYVIEDLNGIQMKTFRRSSSVTNPSNDVFIATLEITTLSNRATGNYTCRSTTRSAHNSNHLFIFWEGSSSPSLVLSGKVLEIEPESNTSTAGYITLPCYVSHPSTSVNLFKDVDGEFKAIPSNILSHFDPQRGFELTYRNISDAIGRYRCATAEDDDDGGIMEVLVKKGSSIEALCDGEDCLHRQLSPGTRFYFDEKTEELVCCGRPGGKPTRLHTLFCSNPSMCQMYESGIQYLSGSNGKRSGNGSCIAERIYPRDFGLVRCKGSGIDVFTYVYTEFWTPDQEYLKAVFDWRDLDPKNMIHLAIHSSPPYYNRQLVTATCQTLHSYFSDGIKWGIKWHNGSISYFDSILSTDTDTRLHGIRSTYMRLNSAMAELICFAPVWNSTEWVTKSLTLNIKASRSPSIVGQTIEEHTFSLNETEKILECVSSAEPTPKIKWTRDDKEVPRNMVIWNSNGTSVLLFKTVSYQNHGVYKCIAQNEVGQARKLFRIFVEDTRHTTWSTAFAVVIPILVITSIAIFAFLLWKMQIQKNVVSHLTRVVFRDSNNT